MKDIILETVSTLKEYLPRLIAASKKLPESLQSGNQLKAINELPEYFEGLQWVLSALVGLQKNGYFIEVSSSDLNSYLLEVEESIKSQDYVLMADLLEYEILPKLEEWYAQLNKFEV